MINFLIILTGLPASGKSYFAQILKSVLERDFKTQAVKIFDPDIIRAKNNPIKFNPEKEIQVKMENLREIERALKEGLIVISDDLNYYTSMRQDLRKIAKKLKLKFFIIHISTPLEVCLEWNEARGYTIPNELIIDISNKFDTFGTYKWDEPILRLDISNKNDIEARVNEFIKLIKDEEADHQGLKKKTSNPQHELLDKITRKIVKDLLINTKNKIEINQIVKLRKEFIKKHLFTTLNEPEIEKKFKDFLKRSNVYSS